MKLYQKILSIKQMYVNMILKERTRTAYVRETSSTTKIKSFSQTINNTTRQNIVFLLLLVV